MPQATQQIVVGNSLGQMLAQGKVQVATVNGQQVLIKPMGNNQWGIVAHFKTQADGTVQIVPTNSQLAHENQVQTANTTQTVTTQLIQTPAKSTVVQQQQVRYR